MLYITSLTLITNKLPIPLPIIALIIFSPLVANVLPIIKLPMTLRNLPIAANGLPLVPVGKDILMPALDAFGCYQDQD